MADSRRAVGSSPAALSLPAAAVRAVRHPGPLAFLERAGEWLLRDEAENNLPLSIARAAADAPDRYEPPLYFATLETAAARVVGCAFRTPPYKLGITRMPEAAVRALCEDVARVFSTLPAVLGPEAEAAAFAACWAERTGASPVAGMRQRIFRLDRLLEPGRRASGGMRPAFENDVGLVASWLDAFQTETGVAMAPPVAAAERAIARGAMFLWQDAGESVAMAGWAGETPNGVRIGPVYTPPRLRGHGYATALTAAVSRAGLETGRLCFLYTDLANPTSNSIYQRIGYRPVCDVMDYTLS